MGGKRKEKGAAEEDGDGDYRDRKGGSSVGRSRGRTVVGRPLAVLAVLAVMLDSLGMRVWRAAAADEDREGGLGRFSGGTACSVPCRSLAGRVSVSRGGLAGVSASSASSASSGGQREDGNNNRRRRRLRSRIT